MRARCIPILAAALTLSVTTLAAGVVSVSQQHRAFSVATLRIARSDTIRFSNEDKFRHQIYVDSASFKFESDEQAPGTAVDIGFTQAGLFQVRCHIHPKMLLQVEVQ